MRGPYFRVPHQLGKLDVAHSSSDLCPKRMPTRIEDNSFAGFHLDFRAPAESIHLSHKAILGVRPSELVQEHVICHPVWLAGQELALFQDRLGQRDDTRPRLPLLCDRLVIGEGPEGTINIDPLPSQLPHFCWSAAGEAERDQYPAEANIRFPKERLKLLRRDDPRAPARPWFLVAGQGIHIQQVSADRPISSCFSNQKSQEFGGRIEPGIAKKERIVILLKALPIKEDNDACESRSDSGFWMDGREGE